MTATLPAIHAPNHGQISLVASSVNKFSSPSDVASREDGGPNRGSGIVLKRKMTRREQEHWMKEQTIRSEIPILSIHDTAQYRNSLKQRLCTEMLQRGYHRSFAEIFELIKQQKEDRLNAGPDSMLWNQKPLTEETEKLQTMKMYLTEAERSLLKKNYLGVYENNRLLAQYFQSCGSEYKWLADHFFENCLHWSSAVADDEGKAAADGHCNIGLSLEESGRHEEAADNFEVFYALTKDKPDWMTSDGVTSMHNASCHHLARIYITIARQRFSFDGDVKTNLMFLTHAFEMAREGSDERLFGESSYQLGVSYEQNGESETALMYLQSYLDSCRSLKDNQGIGKACDAIAKSYNSQGRVDESIKYLEMFINVSEENKDEQALSEACKSLGTRFNTLGRYDQAAEYFSRSYNIARAGNNSTAISMSRVLLGVARGHQMLRDYALHVESAAWPSTQRVVEWKDARTYDFDKPVPTSTNVHEAGESTVIVSNDSPEGDAKEESLEVAEMTSGEQDLATTTTTTKDSSQPINQ